MSRELERRIREAWSFLPRPSAVATRRAREAALRPRGRLRRGLPLAGALVLALAAGVAGGLAIAPASSGGAAPRVTGAGFLPLQGWTVVQSGREATPARPSRAVAANVRLHREDDADRLPYRTLVGLPPHGVVLVVSLTVRHVDAPHDSSFPPRRLPLRLADAIPEIQWSAQVRPRRPLAQYQLRAGVGGYNVDVHAYFGSPTPSAAALAAGQRQLARLVVGASPRRPAVRGPSAETRRVTARTAVCPRFWPTFRISFSGPSPFSKQPVREFRSAGVYTNGAGRRWGSITYLYATERTRTVDRACKPARLAPTRARSRLGARWFYRLVKRSDGKPVGYFAARGGATMFSASYTCALRGRIVVHTSPIRAGRRVVGSNFSVRWERTGELLAVAVLRRPGAGQSWFRISKRCREWDHGG